MQRTIQIHLDARKDIEELYRRIAFSIMINNVDDHLHNHGFLYAGDNRWELSPAFDINPFPDRARELKTWISEDSGPESSLEELRSVASFFGLKHEASQSVIDEVATAVSQWKTIGKELGLTSRELESIEEAFRYN